ncbi:type II secretion system protein N [Polymorphobacter fuscus]|uniref:Type II secretion system protein N n=1 Tax=Sandarakinorhabdus fusca TaxID=1439888 RepID=A0A7C9KX31_9SPHN|nr:type II secretion system protein N [Polymorphobacter fuscus]KAB7648989.1 type II secretion system protein N [Polymorphobacter fuscus]MQT16586.1 type II secretion system protein N [Polymorphobacter fuscus]NJC07124.1 general secretion pathway protein N [Polymorphobacter fuscus]
MTRRVRLSIFAACLLFATLALFPLRLAGLDSAGVSARAASGTIWRGHLEAAQLGGIALGDVAVGVAPAALLGGRLRLDFASEALSGAGFRGRGGFGIAGLAGRVGPLSIGGVPVTAVSFEQVSIGFDAGACVTAEGMVRVQPGAGLADGESLDGRPRCEGSAVVLPLASASGRERLMVRVEANRRYRAELSLDGVSEAQRPLLLAAGFLPTPTGLTLTTEGIF